MSAEKLKYLSEITIGDLETNIENNLDRYKSGDFLDMVESGGWSIESSLDIDLGSLSHLDGGKGSDAEIHNSLLIWGALGNISPSLACEDRIWTRLTHVECLEYCRARWLNGVTSDERISKAVAVHFFAGTRTRCRDDNAISRLWWNAFISKQACPQDHENALRTILQSADIRSNFIERSWMVSRPHIASAIIRIMTKEAWLSSKEENYRKFMSTLNKFGGGILFELMGKTEQDDYMNDCLLKAKAM